MISPVSNINYNNQNSFRAKFKPASVKLNKTHQTPNIEKNASLFGSIAALVLTLGMILATFCGAIQCSSDKTSKPDTEVTAK